MKEGKSVTLNTYTEIQEGDLILWILDTTVIAKIVGETRETIDDTNERFRDRLQLDHQTGSLTIRDIRFTDSGEYELKIISDNNNDGIFNVSVCGELFTECLKSDYICSDHCVY